MNEIQRAAQAIAQADALLIGASNGLSIAEGYHVFANNEMFRRQFGDFGQKYGIRNVIEGCFFRYPTEWERTEFLQRLVQCWVKEYRPSQVMKDLLATVGGSVFGRFGFSDVICALLALDAEVELAEAGRIPLAQFVDMPYELDILTHVIVRKHDYRVSYQCLRKAATDFATINACAAYWDGAWHVAVGSRPAKARLLTGDALGVASAEPTADELAHAIEAVRGLKYSSNLWGSERYRRHLAGVLAARAIVDAAPYTSPEAADAARAVCAGEEAIA